MIPSSPLRPVEQQTENADPSHKNGAHAPQLEDRMMDEDPLAANDRPWPVLLLKTMRPKQWTKNVFVFGALAFSLRLLVLEDVIKTLAAFVLFCAISSAVYIMNDLVDRDKDRQHPRKRFRPLASGALSPNTAIAALAVLLIVTVPLAFLLNISFGLIMVLYFISQIGYSFWLKNVVILDVFILASGFVLRAMAGALAISVPISPWLYVCTTLLALFLGLSKRRHELRLMSSGASKTRKILEEYSPALLEEMIAVVTSTTVMAYALYTFSAENLPKSHIMMATIPFVLYAIFRYLYLIYQKDEGGSPEELLLRDRPLLVCIALWGLVSVLILYFAPILNL